MRRLVMPVAVLHSRALSGFDAPPVTVEVHLAGGLPAFNLVGLPDTEVRFVWHEPGPITADSGVLIVGATHSFAETPSPEELDGVEAL